MYNGFQDRPNRLATKMRREFRDRGENLRGIGAASTEELMRRAQMGRDPRENVSEEAFSDRLRNRNYTYDRNAYTAYNAAKNSQPAGGRETYGNRNTGGYTESRRRHSERTADRQRPERVRQTAHNAGGEVQVKGRAFPVGYLVMLAVVTMMIMTILFSISQIYQTTGTIDELERELSELQTMAAELELAVEEKNDIRIIEQIATDQLGMVKEDSVQRKYISLSDGERIDIIGEEEDAGEVTFGTLLSSLASALAGFFGDGSR